MIPGLWLRLSKWQRLEHAGREGSCQGRPLGACGSSVQMPSNCVSAGAQACAVRCSSSSTRVISICWCCCVVPVRVNMGSGSSSIGTSTFARQLC